MGGELGSARNLCCSRERTLPRVSEQQPRNYGSVTIRCLPCRRRRGDAPTLAVLERAAGQRWQIRVMERQRTLAALRRLDALGVDMKALIRSSLTASHPAVAGLQLTDAALATLLESSWEIIVDERPNLRLGLVLPPQLGGRGQGVELACWRCPNRPGKKLRDLYALAEDAIAKGRLDVYL